MTTRTSTFTIPANRTYTFDRNLRKLNKKAATLRADGSFSAKFGNPYNRTLEIDEVGNKITATFIDVEVTGPDFSVGGHHVVTMADFDDVENPTFSDFADSTFAGYNEITRECEHCNTNRPRRKMFILENIETGNFIQVGKSCLKDYLGHSIFDATKGCGFWAQLKEEEESLYGDAIKSVDFGETVEHVVACAVRQIRANGYVSRAMSEEKMKKATADDVRDTLSIKPTDEEKAEAAIVIDWATAEYEFDADDAMKNSSFVLNISNILEAGRVTNKMTGLAACLPAMKQRADDKAARDEVNGKSEHFGEIKKRENFDVEVVAVNYIEGTYGVTTLYTMLVGTNVAKWFSSRDVLNVGEKYTLKATVKDHDEFNGTKQTIITRCAIVEEQA